jgi:hypothetical protein
MTGVESGIHQAAPAHLEKLSLFSDKQRRLKSGAMLRGSIMKNIFDSIMQRLDGIFRAGFYRKTRKFSVNDPVRVVVCLPKSTREKKEAKQSS